MIQVAGTLTAPYQDKIFFSLNQSRCRTCKERFYRVKMSVESPKFLWEYLLLGKYGKKHPLTNIPTFFSWLVPEFTSIFAFIKIKSK